MTQTQPACAGNEVMDLRRLDIGLTGDDVTECSVCQEPMKHDVSAVVVTLAALPTRLSRILHCQLAGK